MKIKIVLLFSHVMKWIENKIKYKRRYLLEGSSESRRDSRGEPGFPAKVKRKILLYLKYNNIIMNEDFQYEPFEKNSNVNTTHGLDGRFGNVFIRNMGSNIISKKNDLLFFYDRIEEFDDLGVSFYKGGSKTYDTNLLVTDKIIDAVFFDDSIYNDYIKDKNIIYCQYGQTSKIAQYIYNKIRNDDKEQIIEKNIYKDRYNSNNDIFLHVRLGDIKNLNFRTGYEYYDIALSQLDFDTGYISSDTIEHIDCQNLIKKYNLQVYSSNEVETVQFASTCKKLILSNGTFSWMMGVFGFFSDIYYPEIKVVWHGDIYIFPEWTKICY